MDLSTIFQISVHGFVCLSCVLLAVATEAALPPILTVPVAIASYFFVDRWQVVRLSLGKSAALAFVAFTVAILEFLSPGIPIAGFTLFEPTLESHLLAGAHLLVFLTWIVLLREKDSEQYWFLTALGVMQVAIGAMLTIDGLFAGLLIVYLFAGVWTMAVFSLDQARRRIDEIEHARESEAQPARPRGPAVQHLLATLLPTSHGTVTGWIQHDVRDRWISPRFIFSILTMSCLSLVVGLVLFLFVPRIWAGGRSDAQDELRKRESLTGFSDQVKLGEMGEILESTDRVMDISMANSATGERIDVEDYARKFGYDEPLFRGTVLARYENGQWYKGAERGGAMHFSRDITQPAVRQEIHLQPVTGNVLFVLFPALSVHVTNSRFAGTGIHAVRAMVVPMQIDSPDAPITYEVYSPLPPQTPNRQMPAIPRTLNRDPVIAAAATRVYLELPPQGLDRLKDLAMQASGVNAPAGRPAPDVMARRLEAFLRDSPEFTYTLDLSVVDPNIDPVEDFLFNRKSGHCEYYASSLALMLRSVGIPSRLISGFKGGEKNTVTGAFRVEQRHAHAWVEALVDDRWIILDPTPSRAREESVDEHRATLPGWKNVFQAMGDLWSRYIVGMDATQQQLRIYGPIRDLAVAAWKDFQASRQKFSDIAGALKDLASSPSRWFSWQGGLATFVISLLIVACVWFGRKLRRLMRRVADTLQLRAQQRMHVEFYERFERLCARHGLDRAPAVTQREFAGTVQAEWSNRMTSPELTSLQRWLIDAFYQIRFGGQTLDPARTFDIDRRLSILEASLKDSACS